MLLGFFIAMLVFESWQLNYLGDIESSYYVFEIIFLFLTPQTVTDCFLLTLDSPCHVLFLVGKCGRPAALLCVCARDRLLPFGKHLDQCRDAAYLDQSDGPNNLALLTAV